MQVNTCLAVRTYFAVSAFPTRSTGARILVHGIITGGTILTRVAGTLIRIWKLPSLLWRHNGHDGVSNHQPHDCLFNHSFRRGSKKTSQLRVTGCCVRKSSVTGEFPAQMSSTRKMFIFDDVIMILIYSAPSGRDKMFVILQTSFSNQFSCMKIGIFCS